MLLRQICCGWCGRLFCVCLSCWRGQIYCSDTCRMAGGRHAHREAQRRYRKTHKGKCAHRKAERRRRKRGVKKNVADRGTTPLSIGCNIPSSYPKSPVEVQNSYRPEGVDEGRRCHFCGSCGTIVDRFPRRGYGGSRNYGPQMTRAR